MDTQKLMDEACPMIAEYGWSYYFEPTTISRGEKLGLDPFAFYFLGRGGVLGDVEAPVVQSAFGYFNPAVLAAMWDAGRAKVAPSVAGREYFEAAHDFARARLSGLVELDGFVEAATTVVTAALRDVAGLTQFTAAAGAPVPSDAPAAALHQVAVLREFRGSAHLVAVVASGLSTRTAHFIRRPEMFATFGWPEDDRPTVTDADTAALAAAEAMTDKLVAPAYGALDDDGASALLAGLRAMGPLLKSEPVATV
jgi:Helix-turn-helix family